MKRLTACILIAASFASADIASDRARVVSWISGLFPNGATHIVASASFVVTSPVGNADLRGYIASVLTDACALAVSQYGASCTVRQSDAMDAPPATGIVVHSIDGAKYQLPSNVLSEWYAGVSRSGTVSSGVAALGASAHVIWIEIGTSVTPCASINQGSGSCGM